MACGCGEADTVCAAKHSFPWNLGRIAGTVDSRFFSNTCAAPAYSKLMCYAKRENSL